MLDPFGECSSKVLGIGPGDTTLVFDFSDPCDVHDYGYDLLRYFAKRKKPLGKVGRVEADDLFFSDMSDHCDTRNIFIKYSCHAWAAIYYDGVSIASWAEGHGAPSGEIQKRK